MGMALEGKVSVELDAWALPIGTALEGGMSGELDAGGGGGKAKRLGEGRVRTCPIPELAHLIKLLLFFRQEGGRQH